MNQVSIIGRLVYTPELKKIEQRYELPCQCFSSGFKLQSKGNKHKKDGVIVFGMWKGVRVGVIRTHGQIGTIFPDSKQPRKKRGKK